MPRATPLKTVDDYFALDDDGRTELLDGVFVVSPSPSYGHQRAVLRPAGMPGVTVNVSEIYEVGAP